MINENDLLKDVFSDLMSTPQVTQPPVDGTFGQEPDQSLFRGNSDGIPTSTGTDTSTTDVQADPDITPLASTDSADDLSWDSLIDDSDVVNTPETKTIDWKSISTAIGVTDEFKGAEDLTKYVETLKKENSELKSRTAVDESLPTDIRDAIEIWKNQGDYHSVFEVGAIDYSKIDPIELFEDEVQEHFWNADGTFREQEYYDYIDNIPDMDKSIRGTQIQKYLVAEQQHQKQVIKQRAEQEKAVNLKNLEVALNRFDKVGDYAITPKVRQQMYKDVASGNFLQELGVGSTGAHQFEKLLPMYFKAKYFDAIQKFTATRTKASTLRQEVAKVGNHNLTPTAKLGNPTEQTKKDAIDMYFDSKGIKR
jgi:hypothetical protein